MFIRFVRLTCAVGLVTLVGASLASPAEKPFLRIISPANGAVVRPGQKVALKLTGAGDYEILTVVGAAGAVLGGNLRPVSKPPWTILLEIPLDTDLGKTDIIAAGVTASKMEVDATPIEVDIEPVEIPPVTFDPPKLSIPLGRCVALWVGHSPCLLSLDIDGTYPDGTKARLDGSSRIKSTSESPSIARVTQNGKSLAGISVGSTKLVVFGKYKIDVTVTDPNR